jgi:hypothetical protein
MIKSKTMTQAENVTRMQKIRDANKILVGNLEGKRPVGRPKHGNTKINLREMWIERVD